MKTRDVVIAHLNYLTQLNIYAPKIYILADSFIITYLHLELILLLMKL